MNMNRLLFQSSRLGRTLIANNQMKSICTTTVCLEKEIDYTKMHKLYALYQKDDGVPVHLKRGPRDIILMYFTWFGLVILSVPISMSLYKMMYPK